MGKYKTVLSHQSQQSWLKLPSHHAVLGSLMLRIKGKSTPSKKRNWQRILQVLEVLGVQLIQWCSNLLVFSLPRWVAISIWSGPPLPHQIGDFDFHVALRHPKWYQILKTEDIYIYIYIYSLSYIHKYTYYKHIIESYLKISDYI